MNKYDVAIIMGSKSDYPIMSGACEVLKSFGVSYKAQIVSAHRTPDLMYEFAKSAHKECKVIIAGAGGAAHLPGMVAAMTTLPVIGVPVSSHIKGIDSILSIAQMPYGVPVATMAINGSKNAALMASRILAITNSDLQKRLEDFTSSQASSAIQPLEDD